MSTLYIGSTIKEAFQRVKGTKGPFFFCVVGFLIAEMIGLFIMSLIMSHIFDINYLALMQSKSTHTHAQIFSAAFIFLVLPFLVASFMGGIAMLGLKAARGEPIPLSVGFQYFHKSLPVGLVQVLVFILSFILLLIINVIAFWGIVFFLDFVGRLAGSSLLAKIVFFVLGIPVVFFDIFIYMIIIVCLQLSFMLVIDQNVNPFKAIKTAILLVWGHVWRLFWLTFVCLLIAISPILIIFAALLSSSLVSSLFGTLFSGIFIMIFGIICMVALLWSLPLMINTFGIMYRELVDKGSVATDVKEEKVRP